MCPFETQRLRIDYASLDDAGFILELLNEPDFIRNIADKGVRDIAGAEAYLRDGPLAMYAKHGHGLLRVSLKQTGEVIGMSGLIRRDTLDYPDLGYAFLQRHHGHGYASEAGAAVLERARQQLKIGRIVAIASPENTASHRVLEKLGFRFDAEIALPGHDGPSSYFICDVG
ncbi:GNAT family N-acetyltransferase [Dyella mobilis]|uniref:GNAT family N-acetyltransferase n=1 Tax=Dyella mobilis TaxID=1849582 RepID=A0ABS2KEV9_9GAMM|nr:GNAT family N-acetyltransferase [Dyella mobilis]MBM7129484.1 GNAT family N-acetyltransferase [Dyella mobilis]GLQ98252.1 N-acetyltransferase [Dyella mobilis]